ncbi:MAG TPA: hypothetical protein VFG86_00330 [Chloroflexota bacterium]|jgi:hypothetical protein|nr:hypothetical protein [Chloroflexota bacterium]
MEPGIRDLVGGALTLNGDVLTALLQSSHAVRVAAITLALVGLSWMLGHCAVLFLNRVQPDRFALTTFGLAFSFVFGALIWVGSTWLVATILPGNKNVPAWQIVPMTAFAYAPLVLSVLVIIPYLGSGIEAVLNTWTLLALVVAVRVTFGVGILEALLCAGVGWAVTKLLPRVSGPRLNALFDNAWSGVTSSQMRAQGEAAAAEAVSRLGSP